MKNLLLLLGLIGCHMGCFALMTWGSWYEWLAIVTYIGNFYCVACCFDDDKNEKGKKQS